MQRGHFLILLACILVPTRTFASCAAPVPGLDWTLPANGATGVPTNVTLWLGIRLNVGRPWTLTLDGAVLPHATSNSPVETMQVKLPQPLTASAHHVVHIAYPGDVTQPNALPFDATFTFDTGAGPDLSAPVAPIVTGFVENAQVMPATPDCSRSLFSPYCLDTGGAMWRTLATADTPAAWVVSRPGGNWPVVSATSCTPKAWYMSESEMSQRVPATGCWQVQAIDMTGRLSPATTICKNGNGADAGGLSDDASGGGVPPPSEAAGNGCVASKAGRLSGFLTALLAFCGALGLRRRRA